MKVAILGTGSIGKGIGVELKERGHNVDLIGNDMYGVSLNAAFIGCYYKPSSQVVADLVMQSHKDWMKQARDPDFRSVAVSKMDVVLENATLPDWNDFVDEFEMLNDCPEPRARYEAYTGSPKLYADHQLMILEKDLQNKNFTKYQRETIGAKGELKGYDRLVVAAGGGYSDLVSNFKGKKNRGRLIHKTVPKSQNEELHSRMDEFETVYVVERPTRWKSLIETHKDVVLAGEYEEYTPTHATMEENLDFANKVIENNTKKWGINYREIFGEVQKFGDGPDDILLTEDFRPGGEQLDPVIDYHCDDRVVHLANFDGQGILAVPELARQVADRLEMAS